MLKVTSSMKTVRLITMLSFIWACSLTARAQMVGDCVFLQGRYVEVGVAPNGGFGSTLPAPASYHSLLSASITFWDPGVGATSASTNFLGFVADFGRDGWTTGTPAYWGDYYLPGTPQEGWAIEVNGNHSYAYIPYFQSSVATTGIGGPMAGTNLSYSYSGGVSRGIWRGNQGALGIRQTTILDTNKLYFTVNVILTNTGAVPLNNIYYMRTLDPDNEQTRSGSFTTNNTIDFRNPNVGNKVLVSAVGTGAYASNAYLGLGTKDCRAKSFICASGLLPDTSNTLAQIYNETTGAGHLYALGANSVSDVGVGIVYNIGTLAAGDSTTLTYAYILNAAYIDSALNATQPELIVNGAPFVMGDTIDLCEYTGDTVSISLTNSGFYDWTFSPTTLLASATSPTNFIYNVSSISGTQIYTITGVSTSGNCDSVVHIIPLKHLPLRARLENVDTTICNGQSVQGRVTGSAAYTYRWSPAAGVSDTTAQNPIFTPSVTTTYSLTVSSASSCAPRSFTFTIFNLSPNIDSVTAVSPAICGDSSGYIILHGLPTGLPTTLYYSKDGAARGPISSGVASGGTVTIPRLPRGVYSNIYLIVGGCRTNIVGPDTLRNPPNQRIFVDSNYVKTCVGVPVLLNTYVIPAGTYNYSWTPPAYLSSSTVSNPIINPAIAGDLIYTVTVNPSTDPTCASDTFVTVHVVPPFVLNNRDTAICIGSSVPASIIGATDADYYYTWSPATGASATNIMLPTLSPRVSTSYTVTGSYANCPDQTASFYIEVDTPATVMNIVDTICLNMSVTYDVTVPGTVGGTGSDYYRYQWIPATDVSNDTIPNPIITPIVVGTNTYSVTITPNAVSCRVTDVITLFVLPNSISVNPADTQICEGQVVQVVGAGDPLFSYQWLPTSGIRISNVLNALITPDTSATYVVHAYFRGCPDITDTVKLDVQPNPTVYIGGNRFVCQFDTLRFDSYVTPGWYDSYSYSWSPAADLDVSTRATTVFNGGSNTKLYLTVTTPFGCVGRDSADVTVYGGNFATLTPDRIEFCPHNDTILTPTGPAGTTYRWYPSLYLDDSLSSTPTIAPQTTQIYTVVATTLNGCKDTFNFNAVVFPGAVVSVEDSVRLYPGQSYHIQPMTNCTSLLWFPPEGLSDRFVSDPIATPEISTRYWVRGVTENGCYAGDSITIYVSEESLVQIPNAFAPGGSNKVFKVILEGTANVNHFRIFNRWGNLLFETKDINEGWDGTYNGTPQPFGVYIYELEAVSGTGKIIRKHGNLTLLR